MSLESFLTTDFPSIRNRVETNIARGLRLFPDTLPRLFITGTRIGPSLGTTVLYDVYVGTKERTIGFLIEFKIEYDAFADTIAILLRIANNLTIESFFKDFHPGPNTRWYRRSETTLINAVFEVGVVKAHGELLRCLVTSSTKKSADVSSSPVNKIVVV